jgi:hypothetical protein
VKVRSFVLLFVFCAVAHADILKLRDGVRITGRWWAADASFINFLVDGHLQRFSRLEVAEVVFNDEPAADRAPASVEPGSRSEPAPGVSTLPAAPLIPEPDQIGAVYFQDNSDHLVPLESTEASAHRVPIPGTRSSTQYWDMRGARSPVRFKSNARLVFVVEVPGGIATGSFKLYPLETRGDSRRTKGSNGTTIPITVRNVAGRIFALSPVGNLAPGEYSFSPSYSNDAYCFGIDALR